MLKEIKKTYRYNFLGGLNPLYGQFFFQTGFGIRLTFLPTDTNQLVERSQFFYIEKKRRKRWPQLTQGTTASADTLMTITKD